MIFTGRYCVGFDKKIDFHFPTPINKKTTLRDIIDINALLSRLEIIVVKKARI